MHFEENNRLDLEAAQRIQEKVLFYSLTLTFTLLALSIETFQPGAYKMSSVAELIGWLSLILSGIAGLYRMRLVPEFYKNSIKLNNLQWNMSDSQKLKLKGDTELYCPKALKAVDIDFYIETQEKLKKHFDAEDITLEGHLRKVLRVHEWCLYLGIICLVFSRAYDTIIHVFFL